MARVGLQRHGGRGMTSAGDALVLQKIMHTQERDRWVHKYCKIVQPEERKKLKYV